MSPYNIVSLSNSSLKNVHYITPLRVHSVHVMQITPLNLVKLSNEWCMQVVLETVILKAQVIRQKQQQQQRQKKKKKNKKKKNNKRKKRKKKENCYGPKHKEIWPVTYNPKGKVNVK